jgi:hypothetical protein
VTWWAGLVYTGPKARSKMPAIDESAVASRLRAHLRRRTAHCGLDMLRGCGLCGRMNASEMEASGNPHYVKHR